MGICSGKGTHCSRNYEEFGLVFLLSLLSLVHLMTLFCSYSV
ncbi:hypothetical protein F383_20380 [Gossypium arboreum]|uniref:Uncharacterized protein n=1 Tax=Gossypium arboreum TaxID=29729 RepID=A0A0B0NNY1_GOSAR|nr:hypothetical protein F383_20380 [Gossypium arboreum]